MQNQRITKKSRLVKEFSDCMVDLVTSGTNDPSKKEVVSCVVSNSITPQAGVSIETILQEELANELDRYWSEVVKLSAERLGLPYHGINKHYYKAKGKGLAKSKAEAQGHVATFANGRTGAAVGVRFVEQPHSVDANNPDIDIYLTLATERMSTTVVGAAKAIQKRAAVGIKCGVLPEGTLVPKAGELESDVKKTLQLPNNS